MNGHHSQFQNINYLMGLNKLFNGTKVSLEMVLCIACLHTSLQTFLFEENSNPERLFLIFENKHKMCSIVWQ